MDGANPAACTGDASGHPRACTCSQPAAATDLPLHPTAPAWMDPALASRRSALDDTSPWIVCGIACVLRVLTCAEQMQSSPLPPGLPSQQQRVPYGSRQNMGNQRGANRQPGARRPRSPQRRPVLMPASQLRSDADRRVRAPRAPSLSRWRDFEMELRNDRQRAKSRHESRR